jgi:hypothetical protein
VVQGVNPLSGLELHVFGDDLHALSLREPGYVGALGFDAQGPIAAVVLSKPTNRRSRLACPNGVPPYGA